MRPSAQTTAAPIMAKPMTFNPSPMGVVFTTGGDGGGADFVSEQEPRNRNELIAGNRREFLVRWNMMKWFGWTLKTEQPGELPGSDG